MDSKYHRIKKILSEEPTVPSHLDWEKMEAGILGKMEAMSDVDKTVKKRNRGLLLFMFLSIVSCSLLFIYQAWGKTTPTLLGAFPEGISEGETALKMDKESFSIEEKVLDKRIGEPSQPVVKKVVSGFQNKTSSMATTDLGLSDIAVNKLSQSDKILDIPQTSFLGKTDSQQSEKQDITGTEINDNSLNGHALDFSLEPISSKTTIAIESKKDQPKALPLVSFDDSSFINSNNPRHQISFSTGITLWNPGFGQNEPERASLETQLTSIQTSLQYSLKLRRGFFLKTGLQYQELRSRFDWTDDITNHSITLEDIVIQVQTNIITGEKTETIGDVDFLVPAQRIVRHYNSIKLIQVPLSVGKQWNYKKWGLDASLGLQVNVFSQNEGQTFYQDELVNFNGSSTAFLNNRWGLFGMASMGLSHPISHHFYGRMGIQFQQSISDWSTESNVTMRPRSLGFQLGVGYNF